jgi:hypothetical protein
MTKRKRVGRMRMKMRMKKTRKIAARRKRTEVKKLHLLHDLTEAVEGEGGLQEAPALAIPEEGQGKSDIRNDLDLFLLL